MCPLKPSQLAESQNLLNSTPSQITVGEKSKIEKPTWTTGEKSSASIVCSLTFLFFSTVFVGCNAMCYDACDYETSQRECGLVEYVLFRKVLVYCTFEFLCFLETHTDCILHRCFIADLRVNVGRGCWIPIMAANDCEPWIVVTQPPFINRQTIHTHHSQPSYSHHSKSANQGLWPSIKSLIRSYCSWAFDKNAQSSAHHLAHQFDVIFCAESSSCREIKMLHCEPEWTGQDVPVNSSCNDECEWIDCEWWLWDYVKWRREWWLGGSCEGCMGKWWL